MGFAFLLYCHLSLIFAHLLKGLHNVESTLIWYLCIEIILIDSFHSWTGKYLQQKMTSSGLSDHIHSANLFFKDLYMKYSKIVFQSFIELKVALLIHEKVGMVQNQFKTLP